MSHLLLYRTVRVPVLVQAGLRACTRPTPDEPRRPLLTPHQLNARPHPAIATPVGMCRSVAVLALLASAEAQTPSVTTRVDQTSTAKAGYTTYRVLSQFDSTASEVYALFGESGNTLVIPPAFQVAAPFGSDVGPVSQLQRLLMCLDGMTNPVCRSLLRRRPTPRFSRLWRTPSSTVFSPSAWTAQP